MMRSAFGIHVVDVRIRRADLPEQNSEAVYKRMQTERQREAAEFRAEGSQKAQAIRAKADRDVTVIVADANQQSEQIRGQGDAERNGIFAQAYGQDPGFFAFYRSMQAYERACRRATRTWCWVRIRTSSAISAIRRDEDRWRPVHRRRRRSNRTRMPARWRPCPAVQDARAAATAPGK